MNHSERRRVKMRLYIPPEASNIITDKERSYKFSNSATLVLARERRISMFTRILEPSLSEPFYFLFVTMRDSGIANEQDKGKFKSLLTHVNKMKPAPKFIVLCGGIVDNQNSRKDGEKKEKTELEGFLDCLNSSIKVLRVASKEDFKKGANKQDVDEYRDSFGDDWYGFWVCGVAFLVINSFYIQEDISDSLEAVRDEQEDWIESELLQQQIFQAKWSVVLQDTAPAESKLDDDNDLHASKLLEKFHMAGVSHIFCRKRSNAYEETESHFGTEIVSSDVTKDEVLSIRLIKMTSDEIRHRLYTLQDLPEHVNL